MTKVNSYPFFLLILSTILLTCNPNKPLNNQYQINAEIIGIESGKAQLVKLDLLTNEKIIVDSTIIKNEKFIFEGKLETPYIHTIHINDTAGTVIIFLENSKIEIKGTISELDKVTITGSKEDSLFRSYSIDSLFEKKTGMEIMTKYPSNTFAAFVAYYQFQIHNIPLDKMETIISSFSESVKSSLYYEHLVDLYQTIKRVAISQPAPNFKLPNTKGDTVALSDFKGKYVLLDFWASWCAPCRASNPKLVEAYQLFNKRDFTIIGISVDKNKEQWLKAIDKDGLLWTNLSNLKGWDEVSNLYGVKAVPQNFLIDRNGIIIDKNITEEQLIEKLNDILSMSSPNDE